MEGLLVSCIVTLLFILVMWLEPRRFSGVVLFFLSVCTWTITLTDLLNDKGAAFSRLVLALLVVVAPLTILCTGMYILFYSRSSKCDKKKFAVAKSIGFLIIVGIISAAMWILAWYSYIRFEYHRYEIFKRVMEPGDYIIDLLLLVFWFVVITFAFSLLGFGIYAAMLCRTPKQKEYSFVIIHGDGMQHEEVDTRLADYLDRAIEIRNNCCTADSRFMIFGSKSPGESISEARMMAGYLMEKGINKESITINENIDGPDNVLVASKKIIDKISSASQAVMLTKDYMVFRMNLYARKLKMDLEPIGFKFRDNNRPFEFFREYVIVMMWYKWLLIIWFIVGVGGIAALLL
ncbi:MAG: YdcF family protein [Lachnospiraceae bacterium]